MLTDAQKAEAEQERLTALSHQSQIEDTAIIEIVYGSKFVRFDISTMEAAYLTPEQLVTRHLAQPLADVGLQTQLAAPAALSSASETNV